MPGRGQYWKIGGLNDGVVRVEDLHPTSQIQHLLSFLLASSSATQVPVASTKINIDTIDASRGTNISLNTGTSQFTLKANKTYKLFGNAGIVVGGSPANVDLLWFDVTNAVNIGSVIGHLTADANSQATGQLMAVITPSVDILVEFRIGLNVGAGTTLGFNTAGREILPQVLIEEI